MAEERKPVPPVGRGEKTAELQEEIQGLIEKEQILAKEAIRQKEEPTSESLARIAQYLPKLIQRTLAKLEAAQVYQTFKLPGRDYIVHDRRDKEALIEAKEKKDAIAEESKRPLSEVLIQKGKLAPAKEKSYENYPFFSRFEQALLKRFEGGGEIIQKAKGGEFVFLGKTLEQWKDFFSHFVQRTVRRHALFEEIQEWIFRGLVQRPAKATLISDWAFHSGQMEKFVRFRLPQDTQGLAALLAGLNPGAKISKDELKKYLGGELEYLAIKGGEEESFLSLGPTKGKFLTTLKAEEKVASDLGIQLGAQLKEKERLLKSKKGLGTMDHGPWTKDEDQESQFVPWWQFGPLKKRRGPVRWFVIATYLIILSLVVIGILSLI